MARHLVLVIEDEIELRELLVEALNLHLPNLEITAVANGDDALSAVHSTAFSCIITDLNIPGPNGQQLVNRIAGSALNAKTPIIVVSGSNPEDQLQASTNVTTLSKPFDNLTLAATTRDRIKYSTAKIKLAA